MKTVKPIFSECSFSRLRIFFLSNVYPFDLIFSRMTRLHWLHNFDEGFFSLGNGCHGNHENHLFLVTMATVVRGKKRNQRSKQLI